MTNPTPHGQVPEALIDLIDAYAETRHRCGGIYNAKTEAARKAVIEALSGVQALSAAPAGFVPVAAFDRLHAHAESLAARLLAAEQAAPKAAPGVGNSGFDHQTAADFLSGKTVSVEALRKFVHASRRAHDEKTALSAMLLSVRGVLASREAEIALLKKALMEAEAAPQQEAQEPCPTCAALARTVMLDQASFDRKPDCYGIRQITDDEGVEEWEDIRTSPDVAREEANDMMATGRGEIYEVVPLWKTPQPAPATQQAGERVYAFRRKGLADFCTCDEARYEELSNKPNLFETRIFYTAPQPAPAPLSDDAKDAARYRWLREGNDAKHGAAWHVAVNLYGCEWDAAIDAAIAAQGGTP